MPSTPIPDAPAAAEPGGSAAGDEAPVAAARPRSRIAPASAAAVAVVLAMFVWLLATREGGDKAAVSSPLLGKVAPTVVGTGFRGDAFNLDDHRSGWVLVNFFSTTCVPCKIEHPELVELETRHKEVGDLAIVSVTFEDSPTAVQTFFEANRGSWPVLLTDTGKIAISFGVTAVPESYLIAPGGIVVRKVIGGITADSVDELINRS